MERTDELKLTQDAWIKLWHTYITWFTWHFAIHMTILAGLLTIPAVRSVGSRMLLLVIFTPALLGFGAAVAMLVYQHQVRHRVIQLDPDLSWTALGGALADYAQWATVLTNLVLVVMWGYIISIWPIPPTTPPGPG